MKRVRGRRVDLGEQLLELIDQQQQLRAVVGQDVVDRTLRCLGRR